MRVAILGLLLLFIAGIYAANRSSRRHHYRRSYFRKFIAQCPVKNRQRFFTRRTPGPVFPNPGLPSKRIILVEIDTVRNFVRDTNVKTFLKIYRNNGFSDKDIDNYILRAIKYNLDFWGIDLTEFTPREVLKQGGVIAHDGAIQFQTTTFSDSSQGKDAAAKAISESGKFCRTFKRQPIDASGVYVTFLKDFEATKDNVTIRFEKGSIIIFHLHWFIPGCGIKILTELTHQATPSEDPKNPNVFLDSSEFRVFTEYDKLRWGVKKLVRTIDENTGIQEGFIIFTWDDTEKDERRQFRNHRQRFGRKRFFGNRSNKKRNFW